MRKKVIIMPLLICLWGGSMIYAATEGQKIAVAINGIGLGERGVVVDGTTYLPVRDVANSQQSIIQWDESGKKISIFKPNVHLILLQDQKMFGNVDKNKQLNFHVLVQVDNLKTEISDIKVTITDPMNREELIHAKSVQEKKEDFWFLSKEHKYNFGVGVYKVRCYMKSGSSNEWSLVSEKQITTI